MLRHSFKSSIALIAFFLLIFYGIKAAVAQELELFVSSGGGHFLTSYPVQRYNGATGAFRGDFTAGGDLESPYGFAFGPDGNLYVTSYDTNSILRYNGVTGVYIDVFVPAGSGGLNGPVDLKFGSDGHLYVSSNNNATVLRYNSTTGAPMPSNGNSGAVFASSGGLNTPNGLVFGPDNNLYVSSYGNDCILRYDGKTGAFLGPFVAPPNDGGLVTPYDLVFGPDGNLYVVSLGARQIMRYNGTTGAPMPSTGNSGAVFATIVSHGDFGPTHLVFHTAIGVTVSGTITLDGCVNSVQPNSFEFRPTDGSTPFTQPTTLNANGTFTLLDIPAKPYTLHIKGTKWLAANVAVDTTNGAVSNVSATLLAGDANNDNKVDFDDLTILAIAYNTAIGDPLYDDRADFNCDGQVEFADLTLLAINYNLSGDP